MKIPLTAYGILVCVTFLLSSCERKTPPSPETTINPSQEKLAPPFWKEHVKFIEDSFPKYTSCDSIHVDYVNNSIIFKKNGKSHVYGITELVETSLHDSNHSGNSPDNFLTLIASSVNNHNFYPYRTAIISRQNGAYIQVSSKDLPDKNPVIQNRDNWNEQHKKIVYERNGMTGLMESRVVMPDNNPYEMQAQKIFKQREQDWILGNKKMYHKKNIIDYSHNNSSISFEIKSGQKTDNYIQFSFKNDIIKFEIYDNVEYDEKYDDHSMEIVKKCLSYMEEISKFRFEQLSKENEKREQSRIDSLKKVKRID
jgi:hypothetical protein